MVYLMQHAKYVSEEKDPRKPLSEKGKKDTLKIAASMTKKLQPKIHIIYHSDKLRAGQTADLIAKYLRPKEIKVSSDMNPLDDPKIWKRRLDKIETNIMLVGHLPHLSKLATNLLTGSEKRHIISFQMGGVLCLEQDEEKNWTVKWMIVPDMLG